MCFTSTVGNVFSSLPLTYLEEVPVAPLDAHAVAGMDQVAVGWAHVLLFCQRELPSVSSLSVNGKSVWFTSLWICFPVFHREGDIYMQTDCLSHRDRGGGTGGERERGIVWSDLLCSRVLKQLMESNALFQIVLWVEHCHSLTTEFIICLFWTTPEQRNSFRMCRIFHGELTHSAGVNFSTSMEKKTLKSWWQVSSSWAGCNPKSVGLSSLAIIYFGMPVFMQSLVITLVLWLSCGKN